MLTKSKEHNPNYLAKIVRIDNLKPIEGADRIQIAVVDFQDVIVSKETMVGDIMVYFPIECQINKEFLSFTNTFRNPELNQDKEAKGFFEENARVRAMKMMKGKVRSMGYLVPSLTVYEWSGDVNVIQNKNVGQEFDTINNKLLLKKYVVKTRENNNSKQPKKPKVSRIIDGQVHLHQDTENLRRNSDKISPNDTISITYKTHGTSWWVSNVLVKRRLSWLERLSKKLGLGIQDTKYDLVYGSRRVVKNKEMEDPKAKDHFFGYDLWEDIKNEVGDKIPKGYTLYGEMLGYDKNGAAIQKNYDYGCKFNDPYTKNGVRIFPNHKLEVYRITNTNPDGLVTELSYPEIVEFCERAGLTPPHLFYYGQARDLYDIGTMDEEYWRETFIRKLEETYNEKDCFMCKNTVPEEGIVVRKEKLFEFEAYKLKSFRFLEHETKQLDKGETNIEDNE